jgi:membrane protein
MEDNCKFRASALTFFTILSIVPIVAVMFAVAGGFGMQQKFEAKIEQVFEGQEKAAEIIIDMANQALSSEELRTGLVGTIAIAFFFWTIIKVLSNVENSFNEIWGIKRGRHIGRRFADYLSIVLVCPILIVVASSMTVAASSHIEVLLQKLPFVEKFWYLISWALQFTRYITIWIVFTFLLMFMPNTKVKFKSGIFAGIVTGTLFVIIQGVYVRFQIGAANAGVVYGSLATFPLFFIWLHVSWLIVLFGAELAFAHQNVDTYEFEQDCLKASYSFRRLSSLVIAQRLVENFMHGKGPSSAEDISHYLEMPVRLVRDLLFELVDAGIVSETYSEKGRRVIGYQPGMDINKITIKFVIDALQGRGVSDIPIPKTDEMDCLKKCLKTMDDQAANSKGNVLLKSITLDQ